MQRLFKFTPLEDSFSCNFNVLIAGVPRVLGVGDLLQEWVAFRIECVRRRTHFDLSKKRDKLHLLKGLQAILLDIDKAVAIVRNTEEEAEVVPNLMIGFGIDEVQAEYVAEIKLRHLNREYILKRTEEVGQLEKDIAELQGILDSKAKVKGIIIKELQAVAKQYGQPRRTMLLYSDELEEYREEEEIPDYPVHLFFTPRWVFQEDHAAVAAHERGAEAQRGRRGGAAIGEHQQCGPSVLYGPGAGVPGKGLRFWGYQGQRIGRIHPCKARNGPRAKTPFIWR